jgi:phosphorylase/glycogen(starch) synthase
MRAEWWNVQVVSYTQPDASYSLSPTNSLESEVVLRIGDLDPNEIGVEILFTTTGKDGRQHIREVAEYEVVECNAGVARYRASVLPERTGMYQVATRMYAKNPLLPHRQDFELVRWL